LSIIGSSSIDTAGELYVVQLNAITKGGNKRNKRLLDFFLSLFFLVSFPVTCWAVESKKGFLRNIFTVLFAEKSWVGFAGNEETKTRLPKIRAGIITPADQFNKELPEEKKLEIDMVYAKNYRILQDVELIFQAWKNLGR
jgi:lipopolysaccharide/colanic/teichoic acid biosynthesis glycosyltransferase